MKVYAGIDPLTGREIRLRRTCKTERAAQIELGKLLAMAQAGRQPDSAVTVAQLLDQYVLTASWDVSTRVSNLGYIRRTIKPALGSTQVRKVRGPLLDTLYVRLMRCGNLACTGRPFTEHRNIPDLRPDPADRRLEWEQVADGLRAAIRSGQLTSGDTLPSVPDLARLQKVLAEARARSAAMGLYLWLVVVTGVRRGELCGLQIRDVDLDRALVHVAFNYVVRGGQRVRKDTKAHQDRWLAIDPVTCALIESYLAEIKAELAAVGVELRDDAYLFSNDPAHARPWNPDWVSHRVAELAAAAGVELDIKGGRHYTASQLLAGGFDLRNTAARLGHSGGGATTLRHYANPVPEVDRRAAAYLAQLTAGSATQSG